MQWTHGFSSIWATYVVQSVAITLSAGVIFAVAMQPTHGQASDKQSHPCWIECSAIETSVMKVENCFQDCRRKQLQNQTIELDSDAIREWSKATQECQKEYRRSMIEARDAFNQQCRQDPPCSHDEASAVRRQLQEPPQIALDQCKAAVGPYPGDQ